MNDFDLNALLRAHEGAAPPRFAQGFADRVMRRVLEQETPAFDLVLAQHARRVLPALAAASMALAVWNYVSVRDRAPSAIGAVLGVASLGVNTAGSGVDATGLTNVEAFE